MIDITFIKQDIIIYILISMEPEKKKPQLPTSTKYNY